MEVNTMEEKKMKELTYDLKEFAKKLDIKGDITGVLVEKDEEGTLEKVSVIVEEE